MKRIGLAAWLLLAACSPGETGAGGSGGLPGSAEDRTPFSEISADALVRFTGTEPFWGGSVEGSTLIWTTPENPEGTIIPVTRFAGRGGLTFSGRMAGEAFDMAVTPGTCSDGMSDRTYPFFATVRIGATELNGCAWREGDDLGVTAP